MPNWVMIGVALTIALVTLNPRIFRSDAWRATATPLASIIGSGFLIAGPILASAAGHWAVAAMAALCAVAWLFGSAIRYNIVTVEPLLDPDADGDWDATDAPRWLPITERVSDIALAFAYFISVAYYLNLFAAFGLRALSIEDRWAIAIAASVVITILGIIGLLRGLRWLENVELPAVGVKLALIGGLIGGLAWAVTVAFMAGQSTIPSLDHARGMHELGVLLGLVILVQGFETSRYLGHAYSAKMRCTTMRRAQMLATLIYVIFIGLMTPYFRSDLVSGHISETAIIDILRPVGWIVAPLVTITALASQLSASVADMNGAGGLINTATEHKISVKLAYAATAIVAIIISLTANLFEIVVYASKAFVLYYGLQSATATLLSLHPKRRSLIRATAYGCGVVIALAVVTLGVSAG